MRYLNTHANGGKRIRVLGTTCGTLLRRVVEKNMALGGEVAGLLIGEDALFTAIGRARASNGPAAGKIDFGAISPTGLKLGECIAGDEIDGFLNSGRE